MPTFEDYRKQFSGIVSSGTGQSQDFVPGPQHKRVPSESEIMSQNVALREMSSAQEEPMSERDQLIASLKPLEKIVLLEIGRLIQDRQNLMKSGKVKKSALELSLRVHGYDDVQTEEIASHRDSYWSLFVRLYPEKIPKKGIQNGKVKIKKRTKK